MPSDWIYQQVMSLKRISGWKEREGEREGEWLKVPQGWHSSKQAGDSREDRGAYAALCCLWRWIGDQQPLWILCILKHVESQLFYCLYIKYMLKNKPAVLQISNEYIVCPIIVSCPLFLNANNQGIQLSRSMIFSQLTFPSDPMQSVSQECAVGRGQESQQTKQINLFTVFSS